MKTSLEQQIHSLEQELESLLIDDEVHWDEVSAVERDLEHLRKKLELTVEGGNTSSG